jgi:lipopolysaccharide biosynthesis glycosyltransferase
LLGPNLGGVSNTGTVQKRIHVCLASDEGYLAGLANALFSVAFNSNEAARLTFHVLDGGIADASFAALEKHLKEYFPDTELLRHPVELDLFEGLAPIRTGSPMTYARLLAARLINAAAIVYVDVDTLCLGPIETFADAGFGDFEIQACPCILGRRLSNDRSFEPPENADKIIYFNAGILGIDLNAWREKGTDKLLFERLRSEPERYKSWDQSVLNWHYRGRFREMDNRWNCVPHGIPQLKDPLAVSLVHYAGGAKPWLSYPVLPDCRLWWFFRKTMRLGQFAPRSKLASLRALVTVLWVHSLKRSALLRGLFSRAAILRSEPKRQAMRSFIASLPIQENELEQDRRFSKVLQKAKQEWPERFAEIQSRAKAVKENA